MEEQEFDAHEAERRELELLNKNGMTFEVGRRWGKFWGRTKPRTFKIQSFELGVMDRLSAEYHELDMEEELLNQENLIIIGRAKDMVTKQSRRLARIVAIAVIGNNPYFHYMVGPLAEFFYNRIDSAKLFKLTMIINKMANYGDFINSIRFLRSLRTTQPLGPGRIEGATEED